MPIDGCLNYMKIGEIILAAIVLCGLNSEGLAPLTGFDSLCMMMKLVVVCIYHICKSVRRP